MRTTFVGRRRHLGLLVAVGLALVIKCTCSDAFSDVYQHGGHTFNIHNIPSAEIGRAILNLISVQPFGASRPNLFRWDSSPCVVLRNPKNYAGSDSLNEILKRIDDQVGLKLKQCSTEQELNTVESIKYYFVDTKIEPRDYQEIVDFVGAAQAALISLSLESRDLDCRWSAHARTATIAAVNEAIIITRTGSLGQEDIGKCLMEATTGVLGLGNPEGSAKGLAAHHISESKFDPELALMALYILYNLEVSSSDQVTKSAIVDQIKKFVSGMKVQE